MQTEKLVRINGRYCVLTEVLLCHYVRAGNFRAVSDILAVDKCVDVGCGAALAAAAGCGNRSMVELLISKGADVRAFGGLAVCAAARAGHWSLVEFLAEKGASIQTRDNYALRCAIRRGNLTQVQFLVRLGADIHGSKGQESALFLAVRRGQAAIVRFLLGRGVRVAPHYDRLIEIAQRHHCQELMLLLRAA